MVGNGDLGIALGRTHGQQVVAVVETANHSHVAAIGTDRERAVDKRAIERDLDSQVGIDALRQIDLHQCIAPGNQVGAVGKPLDRGTTDLRVRSGSEHRAQWQDR